MDENNDRAMEALTRTLGIGPNRFARWPLAEVPLGYGDIESLKNNLVFLQKALYCCGLWDGCVVIM